MANIEVVIKISETLYTKGFESILSEEEKRELIIAIGNGTSLPKGHGDLIDRGELLKQPIDKANYPSNYVKLARTIVEADKSESEEEK